MKFRNNLRDNLIEITGGARLAIEYFRNVIAPISYGKTILDIGCGDAVLKEFQDKLGRYIGVDIGAGCYAENETSDVHYIRNEIELKKNIEKFQPNISMLINVLEHTEDFTGLFETALKVTSEHVFVVLPNEENIHLRLEFLIGKGIRSHSLDMYGKHLNHRHLWLIQRKLAVKILNEIAFRYGFTPCNYSYTISYPTTLYKRVIYRAVMMLLPIQIKSRSFSILYKK